MAVCLLWGVGRDHDKKSTLFFVFWISIIVLTPSLASNLVKASFWIKFVYFSVTICIAIVYDSWILYLIFELWVVIFYPWFLILIFDVVTLILILDKDKYCMIFFLKLLCFTTLKRWQLILLKVAFYFTKVGILHARVAYSSITVLSSTMLSSIINSPKKWEKRLRFFVMTRVKHRAMHLPTT